MRLPVAILTALFVVASLAQAVEARGGHYAGGHGSSHKHGHYKNARSHDHYEHRH